MTNLVLAVCSAFKQNHVLATVVLACVCHFTFVNLTTMRALMIRLIAYAGISVLLVGVGFCWGNYSGSRRATYTETVGSLMWLKSIDMTLDKGNSTQAGKWTDDAIDSHVAVLSELNKNKYLYFLAVNSPWMTANAKSLTDGILQGTDRYFANLPDRLRPETRDYLSHYERANPR